MVSLCGEIAQDRLFPHGRLLEVSLLHEGVRHRPRLTQITGRRVRTAGGYQRRGPFDLPARLERLGVPVERRAGDLPRYRGRGRGDLELRSVGGRSHRLVGIC